MIDKVSLIVRMKFFIYPLLALMVLPLFSCASGGKEFTPAGPRSAQTDKPWNDQMRPEGAGSLGILNDR